VLVVWSCVRTHCVYIVPLAVELDVPAPNGVDELTRFAVAPVVLMAPSPVDDLDGVV
jgi:hypothetical protein